MSVAVLEVELAEDSIWEAELPDVRTERDLESLPSLDGFHVQRARVRIGGRLAEMDVYSKNDLAFVRLSDLTIA